MPKERPRNRYLRTDSESEMTNLPSTFASRGDEDPWFLAVDGRLYCQSIQDLLRPQPSDFADQHTQSSPLHNVAQARIPQQSLRRHHHKILIPLLGTGRPHRKAQRLPPSWRITDKQGARVVLSCGLTCTEDTGAQKGAFLGEAAKQGIAVVFPDTSPRGAGVEG
jgi:hypothetical protein